jgi:hypothetical protein
MKGSYCHDPYILWGPKQASGYGTLKLTRAVRPTKAVWRDASAILTRDVQGSGQGKQVHGLQRGRPRAKHYPPGWACLQVLLGSSRRSGDLSLSRIMVMWHSAVHVEGCADLTVLLQYNQAFSQGRTPEAHCRIPLRILAVKHPNDDGLRGRRSCLRELDHLMLACGRFAKASPVLSFGCKAFKPSRLSDKPSWSGRALVRTMGSSEQAAAQANAA